MKLLILFALVVSCLVSRADTNDVVLSDIKSLLTGIDTELGYIGEQVTGDNPNGYGLWDMLSWIYGDTGSISQYCDSIAAHIYRIDTGHLVDIKGRLDTVHSDLTNIYRELQGFSSVTNDVSSIRSFLQTINTNIGSVKANMQSLLYIVQNIYNLLNTHIPAIEAYQQSLALIVSNINAIVSDIGVTVNLPSSFNVSVDNFPSVNFNPAWDWQLKNIYGTGEPSSETLVWQNSLDLSDIRSTRWQLFPDMHNDTSFASWAGMLYEGLDQGFESLSSSGVRSVLLLNSISNINAQIYHLLSGLSPNTNLVATTDEQTEAASTLRQEKLTTDSVNSEMSSLDYTPNIYAESLPNIGSRPRLSGVVSSHDTLSETATFDIDVSGFFQTATDMGYTQFAHPDTTLSVDLRPVNEICIAVRQLFLMIFWMVTIALGAKLCLTVYGLYQTIWSSLMSSDSDIGGGQTVNAINYMRHILPQ